MPGKLWRRDPNETGKAQLKEVDLTTLKIEHPTVIYLSGFLTTNSQKGFISGGIKRTEELLDEANLQDEKPDVYAWSHKGLSNLFNLAVYDTFPSLYSSKSGYMLSENIVMPLVADGFKRNADGTLEGTPCDKEEAQKRLRNLTLYGYSAGSVVSQEIFNASLKMMKGIGYEEKDARDLLKEVVLMAVGAVSRPTKENDRFTTVTLVASNDRLNRFKNFVWGTIGTIRRMFNTNYLDEKHTKKLSIRPLSNSYAFLSAAVRPDLHETKIDEDGQREKKWFTPLYPKWTGRRSYHEIPHYISTDPEYNDFANIALNTLSNAVKRKTTPDPLELIKAAPQSPIRTEAQSAYNARIESAMQPTPAQLLN